MVTTRVIPSSPGYSAVMRASGHLVGGVTSDRTRHRSPILGPASFLIYFGRAAKVLRYSRVHRSQKWSRIFWKSCHRDSVLSFS